MGIGEQHELEKTGQIVPETGYTCGHCNGKMSNHMPWCVSLKRPATDVQPQPHGNGNIVLAHVLSDLSERADFGKLKYGTFLKTNNGRDALMDAYQEGLDLVMYLKQLLLEREGL